MINIFLLKGKISRKWKIFFVLVMVTLSIAGTKMFSLYNKIYSPNVNLKTEESSFFYIKTGSSKDEVIKNLLETGWIKNEKSFLWVIEKKNYAANVHAGRYKIKNNMSNNHLVNLLRSGAQTPVSLTFNNTRTLEEFAGKIARQIEPDSLTLITHLKDTKLLKKYGFTPETIIGMFIPNTYQVYWNTGAENFLKRMYNEYLSFWNVTRLKKAEKIGLSPIKVSTLASIIDEETIKNDEKSKIAGVYINRLKKKIKLGACPTLKFALGDFETRRILNKYKQIDSPYNTYKYYGLPPGPIRQASLSGINAVLNHEKHNYLYFCAKDDFSGYHVFSRTLSEHNKKAEKYQKALDRLRIYR